MYVLIFLIFAVSAIAAPTLERNVPSFLGVGMSFNSITSTDAKLSGLAPNISFRRELSDARYSLSAHATPYLTSSLSLVGAQFSGYIGRRIFGSLEREEFISDENDKILKLRKENSRWVGYVDLGYSLTPIFGSGSTATYTGISVGASVYNFGKFPIEYSVKYNKQESGSKSLDSFILMALYVFRL